MHKGKYNQLADAELYTLTTNALMEGLRKGYTSEVADITIETHGEMFAALENNVRLFSGFKSAAQIKAATNLLFDKDGVLRSFSKFKKDVLAINEKYNKTYLLAEYNTTIASGQAAAKWVDIQADAETFPFLQYITVGDDRVRPEHSMLDGVIKEINDPFWRKYYPPNDWQCRCTIKRVRKGVATETDQLNLPSLKAQFNGNSGINKQVFNEQKHPYFKLEKGNIRATKKAINQIVKPK